MRIDGGCAMFVVNLSALAFLILLHVACAFHVGAGLREDFHDSRPLKPGGRLQVETFNGSVEIQGWDKDAVEIRGTKSAWDSDLLSRITIDIDATPEAVRVRAVRPEGRRGNMGVSFVLNVPQKVVLESVVSSNGSIRLTRIEGNARLKTSNGSLRIAGLKGDLDASTSNGAVELKDFAGAALVRTSNGSITADGVRGHLEAATSNGAIEAQILETAPERPIRVESTNGSIHLTLGQLRNNDVIASTSNGLIAVRLPANVNARLDASTSNARISCEFELTARTGDSKSRLEGVIGSGGPLLKLRTSNGSIRLSRL